MPEPIAYVAPTGKSPVPSCHKGTPRRCRVNYKYKYRRASCPLAFDQPLPGRLYRSRSEIMEDGASVSSASGSAGGPGSSSASSSAGEDVLLRIHVPELKVEKCMQFHKEDLIWEVKQQALANLPKELRESFNYGLFYPPQNGRAGKFLDEERPLSDYPFSTPVGYLELKYKRRVYKMLRLEEKSLRALHTRANFRRFIEFVKDNNIEKVSKMCAKGLDPNFHCNETGETPLTLAARLKKGGKMLLCLVNGGSLLDYRTKEGLTPMHRAVQADNYDAVKTLLDLGASPNYRDIRGLTPLYYTVTHATDPMVCEALLHDYSSIGATDNQGWQETHQACRNKLVQHLEHLLYYGSDMNAQNASGNTPLHVCAVNNLEDCARVLLFRGCDKNALNYANQSPYQVAVIAGNMDLAQVIQNHTSSDIVSYKDPPKYNPKRRISGATLSRAQSDPRLEICLTMKPPSPSPSNRSIPPFSSGSSLSENSTGSGSTCTHPSEVDSEECPSAGGSSSINPAHENSDIISDSSGVCTSNSGSNDSYGSTVGVNTSTSTLDVPEDPVANFNVGMLVVCLKQYTTPMPGHLNVNPGDIIEVLASTDEGMLEGTLKGKSGIFPPQCVQEIRLRNPKAVRDTLVAPSQANRFQSSRNGSISSYSSDTSTMSSTHHQIYGTTPRIRRTQEPRTVILHRGKKGFGFVLRGAKATSPLIERPYERGPALQYLDDVDPGGVADVAGLKKGDYLLKINGEDVSQASHEHVVNIIKKSGDIVQMVVMSPTNIQSRNQESPTHHGSYQGLSNLRRGCQTLPRKFNSGKCIVPPPAPPPRDPRTTLSVGRARAKSMVAGLQDIEALDVSMHTNGTSISMSQSAYHVTGFASTSDDSSDVSSPNAEPSPVRYAVGSTGMKIATIKSRPLVKRMNSSPQPEERVDVYYNSQQLSPTGKPPKVYASVAEMKKAKALKARMAADCTRLHKDFLSTPDLQGEVLPVVLSQHSFEMKRKSLSQEDLFMSAQNVANQRHSVAFPMQHTNLVERRMVTSQEYNGVWIDENGTQIDTTHHARLRRSHSAINANQLKVGVLPPPSHPPPPVPLGHTVEVARRKSDYASVEKESVMQRDDSVSVNSQLPGIMSSFRPENSAKLYASPDDIKSYGIRSNGTLTRKNGASKTRSQSLPPGANRQQISNGDKESSGDSGVYSATYSSFQLENNPGNGNTSLENINTTISQDKITYARPNSHSLCESSSGKQENRKYERSVSFSKPSIPDPDYSSEDESAYSLQDRLPLKKSKTHKKKKHSVMFAANLVSSSSQDMSDIPHYAAPSKAPPSDSPPPPPPPPLASAGGPGNFADLIAQKAAERQARLENGGGSAPTSATSSPNKRKVNGNQALSLTDAIKGSHLFNRQKEKVTETQSPETQTVHNSGIPKQSFKPTPVINIKENSLQMQMKNSQSCPNEFNFEDGDNSSSGVSSDQEHMHSQINYVTVINTESETISEPKPDKITKRISRENSSEASESSDEASDRTWILTNDKGDRSDSGKDSDSSSTSSRRSGALTKNAVSLVKLPPPQETSEPDIDMDLHTSRMIPRSKDQDTISTLSSLSSLSSSSGSSMDSYRNVHQKHSSSSSMSRSLTQPVSHHTSSSSLYSHSNVTPPVSHAIRSAVQGRTSNRSRQSRDSPQMWSADAESIGGQRDRANYSSSRSSTLDRNFNSNKSGNVKHEVKYERSIEESLKLIRMHMNSLNEVNSLAGITASTTRGRNSSTSDMVLAPPPEFSDKSLAYAKAQAARVGKTVIHISAHDPEPDLPVTIIRAKKSSGILVDDRTFRNKFVCDWSTRDTTDWLDSLYMPEYKEAFADHEINGSKLIRLNNESLINLGIRKIGHRVKLEKSLNRYRPVERIDL